MSRPPRRNFEAGRAPALPFPRTAAIWRPCRTRPTSRTRSSPNGARRSACRPSPTSRRSISARPSTQRSRRTRRRSRRSPMTKAEPSFANTIEALERAGETLRRVAPVFFTLAGADTNDALEAIERDDRAAARQAPLRHLPERRAFRARRCAEGAGGRAWADARSRRACWSARTRPSCARARRCRRKRRRGWRRSPSGWRCSAPRSARTCSPTSAPISSCWRTRRTLPACPRR